MIQALLLAQRTNLKSCRPWATVGFRRKKTGCLYQPCLETGPQNRGRRYVRRKDHVNSVPIAATLVQFQGASIGADAAFPCVLDISCSTWSNVRRKQAQIASDNIYPLDHQSTIYEHISTCDIGTTGTSGSLSLLGGQHGHGKKPRVMNRLVGRAIDAQR